MRYRTDVFTQEQSRCLGAELTTKNIDAVGLQELMLNLTVAIPASTCSLQSTYQ